MRLPSLPVLTASAFLLGTVGIGLLFFPQELSALLGQPYAPLVELAGAGAFALGMLDWMARRSVVGGIYGRPIIVGNLAFGVAAGATMIRIATGEQGTIVAGVTAAALVLHAAAYGVLLFADPTRAAANADNP